jgi:hypothetical protein
MKVRESKFGIALWSATCSPMFLTRKEVDMIVRHYLLSVALLVTAGCTQFGNGHQYALANSRRPSQNFVFGVQPSIIRPGETAVLWWNIQGATTVIIEEAGVDGKLSENGKFGASGTLQVRPKEDSTYVASCEGDTTFLCASASVLVRVGPPR